MKILDNGKLFNNDDCYPCYSLKLNYFLQEEKAILPIRVTFNEKTRKACYVYVKNECLDVALKEWTDRKKHGNLYYPKDKKVVAQDEV